MIEASNTTPTTTYWLCPLYSFDCDCESVDLTEGIQIKPAPSKLRKYIGERTYHLYGRWEDPSKFDWAAFLLHLPRSTEGTMAHRIEIGLEEWDTARDSLVDLITALKLCHRGRVTAGPLISASIHNSEWSIGGGTIWTPVSKRDFIHEEPKYTFRQPDVFEVNNLLQNIRQWRKDGVLNIIDVALRRFHSAYHGDIEDRIIDQMIAFESLYIGDERGIKNKLALRTASLLGESQEVRERIRSDMKYAYERRCDIVHVIKEVTREESGRIAPKTEEYLRQSIRKFLLLLSQGKPLKEIREKLLDENILENGSLLALRD